MLAGETLPRPLVRVLVGSAVAHALLITALALQGVIADYLRPKPPSSVIVTKLVKLGTKRDEQLLPRLESAPPPPPKAVNLAAPPGPAPAPKPAPPSDAKERLESAARVSNALNRLRGLSQDAGDPDGVPEGEVTDAALALMGSKYTTEIYQCMKNNYVIEGIAPSQLHGKSVVVLVRVQNDGRLFDADVIESSKEARFDNAVLRSVKRCGRVSPPPEVMRKQVHDDGLEIVFRPT